MESRTVAACAEFPNDNPALHHGAIWVCLETTGPATYEAPIEPAHDVAATPSVPEPKVALEATTLAVDPNLPIEPRPLEAIVLEGADDASDANEIEIVDELHFDEIVDESPAAPSVSDDLFGQLCAVVESVASDAGATSDALDALRVVLGKQRVTDDSRDEILVLREQAAAWQSILRGESEDFASCGVPSLDEWSATAIAKTMGQMGHTDALRRELRRRGVAAFGLVANAA